MKTFIGPISFLTSKPLLLFFSSECKSSTFDFLIDILFPILFAIEYRTTLNTVTQYIVSHRFDNFVFSLCRIVLAHFNKCAVVTLIN